MVPFVPLPILETYINNEELREQRWSSCLQTNLAYHALGKEAKRSEDIPKEQLLEIAYNRRRLVTQRNHNKVKIAPNLFSRLLNGPSSANHFKSWLDAVMYAEYVWFRLEARKYEGRGNIVEPGDSEMEAWIDDGTEEKKYLYGFEELLDASKYKTVGKDETQESGVEHENPLTGTKRSRE